MKLFLVGLPGSGKSVLGKELAGITGLPFIDLDAELEKQEGINVARIFSEKGEEYFRIAEAKALRECSGCKEFVMATGGGTPCFHNNMDFINSNGISIFLDTPLQIIEGRISPEEKQKRPLLKDAPADQFIQRLEDLYNRRIKFYQQAHFTINEAVATAQDVLQLINRSKQ